MLLISPFLCFVCKRGENRTRKKLWRRRGVKRLRRGCEEEGERERVCVGYIKRQEYNKTRGCETSSVSF
jgi:hypothetical protein